MSWLNPRKYELSITRLGELWDNSKTDGIFTYLSNYAVPWVTNVTNTQIQSLNINYHYLHSKRKIISPLLEDLSTYDNVNNEWVLSSEARQEAALTAFLTYNDSWTHLYDTLLLEYNPIDNYNITEDETLEEETGSTLQSTVTGSENEIGSTTDTGTQTGTVGNVSTLTLDTNDDETISVSITKGDTLTLNTSESGTQTGTVGNSNTLTLNTTDTKAYVVEEDKTDALTLNTTDTGTNTGTSATAVTGTDALAKTGTTSEEKEYEYGKAGFNSADYSPDTNEDGTATTTHNTTDTTTYNNTSTRTDNLGNSLTRSGTETRTIDSQVTDGGTMTRTGTESTQATRTDNLAISKSNTGTETRAITETTSNTSSLDRTGTESTQSTRTDNLATSNQQNKSLSVSTSKSDSQTGTGSKNNVRALTRHGNIGVTTTQDLLLKERDTWIWSFFNQVMTDLDTILTIDTY